MFESVKLSFALMLRLLVHDDEESPIPVLFLFSLNLSHSLSFSLSLFLPPVSPFRRIVAILPHILLLFLSFICRSQVKLAFLFDSFVTAASCREKGGNNRVTGSCERNYSKEVVLNA